MTLWNKQVKYRSYIRVADQANALKQVASDTIVLIMPHEVPKSLKFFCPCGCGELLTVNLMPKMAKAWKLSFDPGKGFSLWPSVWRDTGCMSHFILRQNTAWLLFGKMSEEESEAVWDNIFRKADSETHPDA